VVKEVCLTYTQSPHMSMGEVESFLREAKIARFCSLNEDGTIHSTPVWYKYENGEIIVVTPPASRKARNVRRIKNVTLLVDISEGVWPRGVIVYGKAELATDAMQIPEVTSLLEKYMPKEQAEAYARGLFKLTKWAKIIVKIERIASFDYNKDEAYKSATRK
jgi:nitroimidazol reductase NimA-like FMN-containing flavoprotein (pyridoxamine 5'-phosphate oxidase superfamily)